MRHIWNRAAACMTIPIFFAAIIIIFETSVPQTVYASISNRVCRVDIRPKEGYTRLVFRMDAPPLYSVHAISGNRIRLHLRDTDGGFFRKYRRYSDNNIGGLLFTRRGSDTLITFQTIPGAGWRDINVEGIAAVTIDVGKKFSAVPDRSILPGREKIWNGLEKLVRDFEPPLKPEIPFIPTDRQILKDILDAEEQKIFMSAEAALYKGRLSEAEEVFVSFVGRQSAIKSLALYRLGETWYKQQKYAQALTTFREAEKLWPEFLGHNPGVAFYYGDSIARSGDLAAGRVLLSRLAIRLSDKKFAPTLLVRLADVLVRQGHEQEGLAMYRTVADNFRDNKANQMARLRLADHDFFRVAPWNYRRLCDSYLEISRLGGDFDLREEAHFKHLLLLSMYAPTSEALLQLVSFQKKFPRGVYTTICRAIRETLVSQLYRETVWTKDPGGLIRFLEEHQEYLAGCIEQPEFPQKVVRAYNEAGRPLELILLFSSLLNRPWSAPVAPFMYAEVADNAELIGDLEMAEKMLRTFLRKFPTHPDVRRTMEKLTEITFNAGKYPEAKGMSLWLLNKGEKALKPVSYYYLGRSLWESKDFTRAAKAIDLYIASAVSPAPADAALLTDAHYVGAASREATGDRKGAIKLLEAGMKLPGNKRSDEFLYKIGQLTLLDGKKQAAKVCFEQIVKSGKDPDWQKLAQQALNTL